MAEQTGKATGKRRGWSSGSSPEHGEEGREMGTDNSESRHRSKSAKLTPRMTAVSSTATPVYRCVGAPPPCVKRLQTMDFGAPFRDLFVLKHSLGTAYLNHGSFGATPKVVLGKLRMLNTQLEEHPDQWFRRTVVPMVRQSAAELAKFVLADKSELVFVENATTGINAVIRSLELHDNDGVLCFSLHYRPILTTLRRTCEYKQEVIDLIEMDIPYPFPAPQELVDMVELELKRSPHIQLAVFDHITSPTSLVLPVKALCEVCHNHGVEVLVDGAHAPGQIPLSLSELNADYYVGTCHKWLFSPKGSAFLWARREVQNLLCPLVTTTGWDSDFVDSFSHQGTRNATAFACVATALRMYNFMGVERVMKRNREMVIEMAQHLATLWGTQTMLPYNAPEQAGGKGNNDESEDDFSGAPTSYEGAFMACIELPPQLALNFLNCGGQHDMQCDRLRDLLLSRFNLEASVIFYFQTKMWVRISCQVYNVKADYERLGEAIATLTGEVDTV